MFNTKTFVRLSVSSIVASSAWVLSFTSHPLATKLTVIPEWNGPDFKVTYLCKASYEKMGILDMQRKGDYVTVNYGALGRRRGMDNFKCNAPNTSQGAGSR